MSAVVLNSTITCRACGHRKDEAMPTDACVAFECDRCKTVLRPKPGDSCVYCSYGTSKRPSMQQSGSCCGG